MRQLLKLATFIFLLFSVNYSYGQPKDDYSEKIDSLILTTSPRAFNGVILITKNGETKYSKAYGYSNFETKTPITLKDNFRIQSNSKQITAVLILKAVEQGRIDLHSPIKKYLPELKQIWADTVTVHQLLNMSSGITGLNDPLKFKPGTEYYYSNPGYGLLGKILESVSSKKYTSLASNLFKQLGMPNTYCYELGKTNAGLVNGYVVSDEGLKLMNFDKIGFTEEDWANFVPTGGIISNLEDLHKWDRKLHRGKILKPESYKLMTSYEITSPHDAFGDKKSGMVMAFVLIMHPLNSSDIQEKA